MRKLVGWIKDNRFVATIIAVLSVVAGAILVVLILGVLGCIDLNKATSAGELLRAFILCIGAIGGVYGLHLATKRQKTFSEQVQVQTAQMQVQANQGFNDRLGRGVELLAKEDMLMRCAGVQILKDLAENANDKQKPIVAKIIYDFFRDNARVKFDSHNNHYPRSGEDSIQDLQDALELLVNLPLEVQKKLRLNRGGQLDFRSLDFSYLTLKCEKLEHIDFSNSCFLRTDFFISEIGDIDFENANFMRAHFKDVRFTDVDFLGTRLSVVFFRNVEFSTVRFWDVYFMHTRFIDSRFTDADFDESRFENSKLSRIDFGNAEINNVEFTDTAINDVVVTNTKFKEVNFLGGEFYSRSEIGISSNVGFPRFFGTDIRLTKFTFDDSIKLSNFFELCYYNGDVWSSDAYDNPIEKVREYRHERIGGHRHGFFVISAKNWSDQPVREWVKVECLQRRLKQAEEEDVISLEKS